MTLPWSAELCDVVNDAAREASAMGTHPTSAFLLRSMLHVGGEAQAFLRSHGVDEILLRQVGIPAIREDRGVVERLYERARLVAASARQEGVGTTHLLYAIADDPGTQAHYQLESLGLNFDAIRTMTFGGLVAPAQRGKGRRRRVQAAGNSESGARSPRQIAFHPALAEVTSYGGFTTEDLDQLDAEIPSQHRSGSHAQFSREGTGNFTPERIPTGSYLPVDAYLSPESQARLTRPASSPEMPPFSAPEAPFQAPSHPGNGNGEFSRVRTAAYPALEPQGEPPRRRERRTSPGMRRITPKPRTTPERPKRRVTRPKTAATPAKKKRTAREIQGDATMDLAKRLFAREAMGPSSPPSPPEAPKTPESNAEKKAKEVPSSQEVRESLQRVPRVPVVRAERTQKSAEPNRREERWANKKTKTVTKGTLGFDRFKLHPKFFPTLTGYGVNMLVKARRGELDPVIGREDEMEQLIDILNKRRANNPVLVGPAGVGKTAIVEGLARRMAGENPPPGLADKALISLDLGALLCGTHLRGSFQERLLKLKKEVRQAEGKVVLFLDEIHGWLSQNGDMGAEAASELKVALARGELPCVGATTWEEFKRVIEAEPAFERRFELIDVRPPNIETSITIIQGIIQNYSRHHQVKYSEDALEAAVRFSDRYIRERTLPDKAISLLDRSGSLARREGAEEVTRAHVAQVVSSLADVPTERLLVADGERFLKMEEYMARSLVGHEEVIERIARVIRRNQAGFGSNRPIGSFLFLGPTGVGKTEAVKVLADFLFGSRKAIVRFDMSEFMESHAVARLLGAPPGYVGFDDGGQLTESVRRHPHQIILLDEVEKAHPEVLNILLQLLDDGRVTDGKGRTVDFSNTVVVMTSNLGAKAMRDTSRSGIGFSVKNSVARQKREVREAVVNAAKSHFPPELWNRIEERLVFHPLERPEVSRIAELLLADSAQRLDVERNIQLFFDDALVDLLIEHGGFEPEYGARPMRKTIQNVVEATVSELILSDELGPGDFARVFVEGGVVRVERLDQGSSVSSVC